MRWPGSHWNFIIKKYFRFNTTMSECTENRRRDYRTKRKLRYWVQITKKLTLCLEYGITDSISEIRTCSVFYGTVGSYAVGLHCSMIFSKWRLGAYFAPILNVIALPRHLFALLLKIVTFNTVLMVLKIVTLLYNGYLCFFEWRSFWSDKYYTCVMYTSYIVHRSCFLMFLTWFCLIFCLI